MPYHVIYDSTCNLCATLVQLLENLDRGERFHYIPMQEQETLSLLGITSQDCELGMFLINADFPEQRWQGSDAAEEIGRLLPMGDLFVKAYQAMPGAKWTGDRIYEQVRDNRYRLFGRRSSSYQTQYPACVTGRCGNFVGET